MTVQACSKCLEGNNRMRIDDVGDGLYLLADEVADIGVVIDVEFGQNVEMAGNRIDFRGDFGVGQAAGHLIGFAELAFDFNEKSLHGL